MKILVSFKVYVLFLSCLLPSIFFGQTDTVYIKDDPIVVKKQVVVEVPRKIDLTHLEPFLSAGFSFGKFRNLSGLDSVSVSIAPVQSFQVSCGTRLQKKYNFSIGVGGQQLRLNSQKAYDYKYFETVRHMQYDTVGYSIGFVDGKLVSEYEIDTTETFKTVEKTDKKIATSSDKAFNLLVPLSFSYYFEINEFYIKPKVSILLVYNFKNIYFQSPDQVKTFRMAFFPSLGIDVARKFRDDFELNLGIEHGVKIRAPKNELHYGFTNISLSGIYFF